MEGGVGGWDGGFSLLSTTTAPPSFLLPHHHSTNPPPPTPLNNFQKGYAQHASHTHIDPLNTHTPIPIPTHPPSIFFKKETRFEKQQQEAHQQEPLIFPPTPTSIFPSSVHTPPPFAHEPAPQKAEHGNLVERRTTENKGTTITPPPDRTWPKQFLPPPPTHPPVFSQTSSWQCTHEQEAC